MRKSPFVIGIDIGSSAVKVSLLTPEKEKLCHVSREHIGIYRIGQVMLAREEGAKGIINVASLYENTALLTNIFSDRLKEKGAWLNIGIVGKKNENDGIRLQTFVSNLLQKTNSDDGRREDAAKLSSAGSGG